MILGKGCGSAAPCSSAPSGRTCTTGAAAPWRPPRPECRGRPASFIGARRADLYHRRGVALAPALENVAYFYTRDGALAPALENVAYFYTRPARAAVAHLQSLMEPLLTLVLGGLSGWVVFSVLGPVYDLVAGIDI